MLTAGSLFSGAGGFDLGFEAGGFDVAWQVEVDRDCISVLERHWPDVPRWRDVSEVDPAELAPVDVVIFGSPCQDFSVAGKRAGMAGERSGLFGEAIRIIRGLHPTPAFVCWENVPGAYSANLGRDFGAVLSALAQCGALDIAWRVLDARHFGVPQRRRRIFLVADFGAERAGQVLFESPSSGGDLEARGAAGERAPGDVEDGAGVVGEPIVYQCHGNNVGPIGHLRQGNGGLTGGVPFLFDQQNRAASDDDVCGTLTGALDRGGTAQDAGGVTARYGKGTDSEATDTLIVANSVTASAGHHGSCGPPHHGAPTPRHSSPRGDGSDTLVVAAPLTAGGHPNSNAPGRRREDDENLVAVAHTLSTRSGATEDGTGRGTPLVACPPSVGFRENAGNRIHDEVATDQSPTLNVQGPVAVAIRIGQQGANGHGFADDESHALDSGGPVQAVAITENQRSEVLETPYAHQLSSAGGKPGQGYQAGSSGMAVRRLTPRECEALQGWPDDRKTVTIHVWNSVHSYENLRTAAPAATPCHRSPSSASIAVGGACQPSALPAARTSCTDHPNHAPHAAVGVLIDLERRVVELRSPSVSLSCANSAVIRASLDGLPNLAAFVRDGALLSSVLARITTSGGVERPPLTTPSTSRKSGSRCVVVSGHGTKEPADDAATSIEAATVPVTSTISAVGPSSPSSDSTLETLCSSVWRAIAGFIPEPIRSVNSYDCELTLLSGHTQFRANGDEISDGPRYRMIGNGVASPVAAWIAGRMLAVLGGHA